MHHCCYSVKYCRKCFVFLMFSRSECRAGVITALPFTTVYSVCFLSVITVNDSVSFWVSRGGEETTVITSLSVITVNDSGSVWVSRGGEGTAVVTSLSVITVNDSGSVWVSRGGEETTVITSLSVITVNEWFCLGLQRR